MLKMHQKIQKQSADLTQGEIRIQELVNYVQLL